jgi:hypothetical protein
MRAVLLEKRLERESSRAQGLDGGRDPDQDWPFYVTCRFD